jgi:hypothetical protein
MQISQQRCRRHALREAAAQCMDCRSFFCRECVTEHDGRLICSDCLLKLAGTGSKKVPLLRWITRGAWGLAGFVLMWLCFYGLGQFLLSLPSTFHEGTYWTQIVGKDPDK